MRSCICCGNEYKYCPTCERDIRKPKWYVLFCNEKCRDVFNAINDYNYNLISKDKAKEIINNAKLNGTEHFNDIVNCEIEKIMATDAKKKAIKKKAKENEPTEK